MFRFLQFGLLVSLGLLCPVHGDQELLDAAKSGPPKGFVDLLAKKDLSAWQGLVGNPKTRLSKTPEQLAELQALANEDMHVHWSVVDGVLKFDGKGNTIGTKHGYKDFELLLDWKIPKGAACGINLRGCPGVQIWDIDREDLGAHVGSGGLTRNKSNPSKPLVVADKPVGRWNRLRIKMVGQRASVWLNEQLVVDNVPVENAWEADKPIYEQGPLELQRNDGPLWFRRIYVRELTD
jgi:hypothetical protein